MYPWREAAPLILDPVLYAPPEIISGAAGFDKTLLPEVADLIGSHLQLHHPLLRFCKVKQLAQYLSLTDFDDAVIHPLCEVLSWSRGTRPVLVEQGQAVNPRMRLTIDSRGIKGIERVSDSAEESTVIGLSLPSHAYIVESVQQLSGVGIQFQLGMSRLRVPASANISIWNIPSPHILPSLAHGTLPNKPLSGRFAALDLDPKHTSGISFFLGRGICAIHGHTKRGSQALQAFQYLRDFHKLTDSHSWIYIPITANDKVIAVSTLTMKSGKYFIGRPFNRGPKVENTETLYELQQSEDRHLTLLYNVSHRPAVSFIGAGTMGEAASAVLPNIPEPFHYKCNSFAPLERVVKAHVFTDNKSDKCRGILLEYENGIKRALGQCRLGLYPVRCYEYPTRLCSTSVKSIRNKYGWPDKGIRVTFGSEAGMSTEEDATKWEIFPMKGILQFSYCGLSTVLEVHDTSTMTILLFDHA
ncbi:hypothetical protein MKX08_005144 [Trichoderma sp. CBMAI-0020]|nr:hypothetical protein MKX08_005144 [Trichoderma sp. CBMAI-0020]